MKNPLKKSAGMSRSLLAKTRQAVLTRHHKVNWAGRKTRLGSFVDLLKVERKKMLGKSHKPSVNYPIFFIENVVELISILPKGSVFSQTLIEKTKKDPKHVLSQGICEYYFESIPIHGKNTLAYFVFIGNKTPYKMLKKMAKMMADPEYARKIEAKVADKTGWSGALYPKRNKK